MSGAMDVARGWVRECGSLCILTGAGVSAESGVPTFRGPEGLWKRRDPISLATPEAFAQDPKEVWEWYQWRRGKIRGCAPNSGHAALAAVEAAKADFLLVTQILSQRPLDHLLHVVLVDLGHVVSFLPVSPL